MTLKEVLFTNQFSCKQTWYNDSLIEPHTVCLHKKGLRKDEGFAAPKMSCHGRVPLLSEFSVTVRLFRSNKFRQEGGQIYSFVSVKTTLRAMLTLSVMSSALYLHGPLTRYVKLRVVHAPGMSGTSSPHDARAVMHGGIAN